jgi:predicted DNA-binding mobile mystery protein A
VKKKRLQIQQLEPKLKKYSSLQDVATPTIGWVKTIRKTLGITLQQLGYKLSISKQAVSTIEQREQDGSITLNSLRQAANALDMELVYGLIPKDGSLENLIDRKARELAIQIVSRTSNTMKLEDQENSKERIKKAIDERADELKREMPKVLWD